MYVYGVRDRVCTIYDNGSSSGIANGLVPSANMSLPDTSAMDSLEMFFR